MTIDSNLASFSTIEQNLHKLEKAEAEGKYVIVHTNAGQVEVSTFDSFLDWAIHYFKSKSAPGETYCRLKEAKQQAILSLNAQLQKRITLIEQSAASGNVTKNDIKIVNKAFDVAVQIKSSLKVMGLTLPHDKSPTKTLSTLLKCKYCFAESLSKKIKESTQEIESGLKNAKTIEINGNRIRDIDTALTFSDKAEDLEELVKMEEELGVLKSNQVVKPIIEQFQQTLKDHLKKHLERQLQGDITKRAEARVQFDKFTEMLGEESTDLYLADALATYTDQLIVLDTQIDRAQKRLAAVQKELDELESNHEIDLDAFLGKEKTEITAKLDEFLDKKDYWPNPYAYPPGEGLAPLPNANSADAYKSLLGAPARDLRRIVESTKDGDIKQVLIHQAWIMKQLEICTKQDKFLKHNASYKSYLNDLAKCVSTIVSFNRTRFTENLARSSTTPVEIILREYTLLFQQLEQFDMIKGDQHSELTERNGFFVERALNDHLAAHGEALDALFWREPKSPILRDLKKTLAFKQPPEPKELQEVLEKVQKTIKEFADKGITPDSARKAKKAQDAKDDAEKLIQKVKPRIEREIAELQAKREACEKAIIALEDDIEALADGIGSGNSKKFMDSVTLADASTRTTFQERAYSAKHFQTELQSALNLLTTASTTDLLSRFNALTELEATYEKLKKLQADMSKNPKSRRDKTPDPSLNQFETVLSAFKAKVDEDIKERETLSNQLAQAVDKVDKEMETAAKASTTIKGLQDVCVTQNAAINDLVKLHKQLTLISNPKPEKADPSLQPTINNFHGMQKKLLWASEKVLTQQLEKITMSIQNKENILGLNDIDMQLIQVDLDKAKLESNLKDLMFNAKRTGTLDKEKSKALESREKFLKAKEEELIEQQKRLLTSVRQPSNSANVQNELKQLQDEKVKIMGTIGLIKAQINEIDRLKEQPIVVRSMSHIDSLVNAAAAAA
jgi:hypothetical protein